MVNGAFDRRDKQPSCFRFADTTECTGLLRLTKNFGILVKRHHDDRSLRSSPHDFARCFKTTASRHNGIHDDDVGMQGPGSLHSFVAIRRFSADLPSMLSLEQMAQEVPHDFVIIHNHYAKVFHASTLVSSTLAPH
jgi:hypothetical protein